MAKATNKTTDETTPAEATDIVESKTRWIKLANPGTSFVDPETNFRLVNEEVKELPLDAGKLTLQWLRNGGIVEAEAPVTAVSEETK